MKPRRFKLALIAATAPFRLPGYYEAVTTLGTVRGDEVELTEEQCADLKSSYRKPAGEWPTWAVLAGVCFRQPEDQGIGDTIARELGGGKSEAFKRHHEAVFGVWAKPCACAGQVASWNALYPYPSVALPSPADARDPGSVSTPL